MRSLIVGMGIGNLYKQVLSELGHQVVSIDPDISKGADLPNVESALLAYGEFDTAHICTPNFTHLPIAKQVARHCKIVFVEKPGVASEREWRELVGTYPKTRFMMVKNNQWRDNIANLQERVKQAKVIKLNWINFNRVPSPGSWFTDKAKSFGGVSRDLLPHLLSLMCKIEPNYKKVEWTHQYKLQRWHLSELAGSDYGVMKKDGVYNVDDRVGLEGVLNFKEWVITADWRSLDQNLIGIQFDDSEFIELGLCPESAYKSMIKDCLHNLDNKEFWQDQLVQDCWIHSTISL